MSNRKFVVMSERVGGSFRGVIRLKCSKCDAMDSIYSGGEGKGLNPAFVAKKFEQKGWEVGGASGNNDICPACIERRQADLKGNVIDLKPKAESPPEMTREHRRIILVKLEEVYLDEKRGYDSGWSDNRVAQDLGIPRAWVTKLRDENFGPNGTNEEMTEFLQQAEALLKEAQGARQSAGDAVRLANDFVHQISVSRKAIEDRLSRLNEIEVLAGKIRKLGAV